MRHDLSRETAHRTKMEDRLLSRLNATGGEVRHTDLWTALVDEGSRSQNPSIIKVTVCKLNKKLRHHEIRNVRGLGYELLPRAHSKEYLEAAARADPSECAT